ncbi:ATP-dependent helicase HrpB [Profundibacterium mesophilum]|uniref:Helicase n=1 Tax=Profundibacterium mesophilum KAUST100406-0324 TaxID=1037889 RepID=A0A921NY64_9RHOB|nr:ATP-dependent helicase HrpB [Profundibacterium mesophilum]KAF0676884.1 Helicase [Profundibacterium mesophilum KAUST100406-0324]
MSTALPIDAVLPELRTALRARGCAVLQAPPGAGKTTGVPPDLLSSGMVEGRIVMLEPRRLAARAAAERMAALLGEPVGRRVGYRIRGEARTGPQTCIEVVTEGILTRMIQSDPALDGVGAIIFDEFHERSLNADLGLALSWEIREALRPDLMLLVMSATLDAAPVAALLGGAPLVTAQGRAFDVETCWLPVPPAPGARLAPGITDLVLRAEAETEGGILVFLPGEREIKQLAAALAPRIAPGTVMRPLYGALPAAEQRAALAPLEEGRKLILSTSIAETSLTIDGIRVVVDAGLARRARFDPGSGMSRLVTEPVSRAEAAQRRGRAGRVAPGRCYRFWTRGAEGALPAFPPAEIEVADLAPLVLELAMWGSRDPAALSFLTQPPRGAWDEARALLRTLGAVEDDGAITAHGRDLARLPVHPRLGHMLTRAGKGAARLAALLAERDPVRGAGARGAELTLRLEAVEDPARTERARGVQVDRAAVARIRADATRLARAVSGVEADTAVAAISHGPAGAAARAAAIAYPDRIGLRRPGDAPRYLLSGGKGAMLDAADTLAGCRLLVVTDTDGHPREARIRQAAEISEAELRAVHGAHIAWHDVCRWSRRASKVVTRQQERFGAIILDDRIWSDAPGDAVAEAMLEGVRQLGFSPAPAAARFLARVALGRAAGLALFDPDPEALMDEAREWLLPHLGGVRSAAQWRRFDLLPPLRARLDYAATKALDTLAPGRFDTPLGRSVPIDYSGDEPGIEVKLQELFGVTRHPSVAGRPLRIALLSPAGRPVQVTMDLPGFWDSSYADVRKDMRGRYPRHPWPENPREATPTQRAKPRGS